MKFDRQFANALAGRVEDRIDQRWSNGRSAWLAGPADFFATIDDIGLNVR